MDITYYDPGQVTPPTSSPTPGVMPRLLDPNLYIPPPGLVDAANVAILLGQPLLLTGEPGTGKTRFAYHLAHKLRWGEPLVFEAKSTSAARDVFYTYDHLNDFRDAHRGEAQPPRHYITLNALGRAILYTKGKEHADVSLLWGEKDGFNGDAFPGPRRSVVLIDEIDKAPRDFPNDILNELELMYFKVGECGNRRIIADDQRRPVIILTSNSEKQLPDPFLRRCVFFDIPFPTHEELMQIVVNRIADIDHADALLRDSITFFEKIRVQARLRKKPATAELIGWVSVLRALGVPKEDRLHEHSTLVEKSLGALVKTREDQVLLREHLQEWIRATPTVGGKM